MECNREEALRAKDIAERKMQSKDFTGARKFAEKAKQLNPEIENISRMICVCDVHCSAEDKVYGNELDWYGILQIEQTADDILIKKQYRKFALLLHPDKNKYAGAEAAFKLIGEAQRVLLDKEKRRFYDVRRRTSYKPVIPHQQASRNVSVARQSKVQNSFSNNPNSHARAPYAPSQERTQQAQPGVANGETFWTQCPFCFIRYQYFRDVMGKTLLCQKCQKSFLAFDSFVPGSGATQPVFPQHNASASHVGPEAKNTNPASGTGFQAGHKADFSRSQQGKQSQKGPGKVDGVQSPKLKKANGHRGKKPLESSESFESDSSLDSEEVGIHEASDTMTEQQFDSDGDRQTRRSNRNKRHVSYNEHGSDEEVVVTPSKKSKGNTSSCPATESKAEASEVLGSAFGKESRKEECDKADGTETVCGSTGKTAAAADVFDSSPESSPPPTFHEYPDPEFCDFDKNREEHCFKVGQIWAAYDTVDAMPRFYAKIKRIFSSGFKLTITWLEPDPVDEVGRGWASLELPFACGKFKRGDSEQTEDRLMFSHVVSGCKSIGRDTIMIYPRKGETWALFKNWDAKWSLMPESERKFEYEFVEILSEYDEFTGIRVAPLGKLKGFASLFCRKNVDDRRIPPAEILRFSHLVPSYRMTGNERIDVPKGSFELDPASIAMNLEEINLPQLDVHNISSKFVENNRAADLAGSSGSIHHGNENGNKAGHRNNSNGYVAGPEFPDPEFFNFDAIRSVDKFQVNQIWALYSDVDGFPKYYGLVKKIDRHPHFKLHIAWLEACFLPAGLLLWKDKDMPISCGQFKIKTGKMQTYDANISFSHLIHAEPTTRKNIYAIYPKKGDVWALLKSWNADMKPKDLSSCDYDVVEVLGESDLHYRVLILEPVNGYNCVFKPQRSGDISFTREIRRVELLRFSHQIPHFRLTNEKGGGLKGYVELDPAAFPIK